MEQVPKNRGIWDDIGEVTTKLTSRYRDALDDAFDFHSHQSRKAGGQPYLLHVLAVSAMVMEDGGDEDQAVAALLHDAPEDSGGDAALAMIRNKYGDTVADLVLGVTETTMSPKPPWRERKEYYLKSLSRDSVGCLRIALADKVHNLESLNSELRLVGSSLWSSFSTGPAEQVWFFTAMWRIFINRFPAGRLLDRYEAALEVFNELVHLP